MKVKRIAIVGATGAVGREFERVLARRGFAGAEYTLLASPRSAGKSARWIDRDLTVQELSARAFEGVDVALFSAGAAVSREFAPLAVKAGAVVIDNSSAFRMDPQVPLVVPEVNPQAAANHRGILANPNCSTIILVTPLWPLHRANPAQRIVVSTYQAASGAGARAMAELEEQTRRVQRGEPAVPELFPEPCAFNVFSHNTPIGPDGFNVEETKVAQETRKILGDETLRVTATCMRVPVLRAHLESVAIEFREPLPEGEARRRLCAAPGVRVLDERAANRFPTPLKAAGQDEILVGRIRQDPTVAEQRGLQMIVCGDQLLKGAALNAVQIMELM